MKREVGKMRKELKNITKKQFVKRLQKAIEIIEDLAEYDFSKKRLFQKDFEKALFILSAIQEEVLS